MVISQPTIGHGLQMRESLFYRINERSEIPYPNSISRVLEKSEQGTDCSFDSSVVGLTYLYIAFPWIENKTFGELITEISYSLKSRRLICTLTRNTRITLESIHSVKTFIQFQLQVVFII